MNQVELIMRRRAVRAFIDADPADITILRTPDPVRTPAGGLVAGNAYPLGLQRGRIVQSKRRFDQGLINTEAGLLPGSPYLLIGRFDMDIQVDDTFSWLGNTYSVKAINPIRTESVLAAIDFDGPPNIPAG